MKDLGMSLCRSFLYLPTFFPAPNSISEKHLARYKEFLGLCEDIGIQTMPTFIVGHMSGENHDIAFRESRNLYSDPFMLEQQIYFVKNVVSEIKDFKSIYGYILSNEMPIYGSADTPDNIIRWVKSLTEAIKSIDLHRLVGTGDGCWNAFGGENGFNLKQLSNVVDFFGPHLYLSETDEYRHSMLSEFTVRFVSQYGLPVFLEEFGASSSQASDENIALYYREVLLNSLLSGASGAINWCLNDFDLVSVKPYIHHPFELKFGIVRENGVLKAAAEEVKNFSKFVLNLRNSQMENSEAVILVPSYYNTQYPFSHDSPAETFKHMLQALTMSSKAGFSIDFAEEADLKRWKRYKLVILPSERKYLATTWEALYEYVCEGGNLYLSYYWGNSGFQQGIWSHNIDKLTSCQFNLKYGLNSALNESISLSFENNSWVIKTDHCGIWEKSYAPLSKCPNNVKVQNLDKRELRLIENTIGKGKVFFCNFPIEHILSTSESVNFTDKSHLFYRYIAKQTSINLYHTDNDAVRVKKLRLPLSSDKLYLIQNISWDEQKIKHIFDNDQTIKTNITLTPKQYLVVLIKAT
jgi:endo-1,4-beta-mannosidase